MPTVEQILNNPEVKGIIEHVGKLTTDFIRQTQGDVTIEVKGRCRPNSHGSGNTNDKGREALIFTTSDNKRSRVPIFPESYKRR